ncbi:class I SAM-dependent methyltransferase [Flavobacterium sedimenticola]|uniref:Class I SAM-dependent methyltransferase n=1 Tax=Flavobacterium sedimenticola TaxID=3043286 RepID=A0ABT6XRG2_9FLAO|nr:class I SAM-dependent methyltransferase [Flavobacterium sedimenticola]MDI9257681.1 class I SAM-dependent methyltransferase [Flavobacterium sedimenticola]
MSWTGERLETYIYTRDAVEHLHRYSLLTPYIADKTVLDIACGEGYGSAIMSKTAARVYGVDIDADTVTKAQAKYKRENLSFQEGSAAAIPLQDHSVDVVVSFETIEHHDKHREMLSEIKRVLKPSGMLIISTPDKLYYSDARNFKNKFHVKELYKQEFVDLIAAHFANLQLLTQEYVNGNSLIQDDASEKIAIFTGNYSEVQTQHIPPLYLIAIAADVEFARQKASLFDGNSFVNAEIDSKVRYVYQSTTYKLGHTLLRPFKFIKHLFT